VRILLVSAKKSQSSFNQLFETSFGSNDGLYTIDEYPKYFHDIFGRIREGLKQHANDFSKTFDTCIDVDFTRNLSFNAAATQDPQTKVFLIGINHSVVHRLQALTHTIFARTPIFPEFGPYNGNGQINLDTFMKGNLAEVFIEQEPPYNNRRLAGANLLFSLGVEYIYLHELAHIMKGHIGRIFSQTEQISMLGQIEQKNIENITGEELQAMEIDADGNAALWCLNFYSQRTSPVLWRNFWEPPAANLDKKFLAKCFLFISGLLIHLFPHERDVVESLPEDTYPHPEIRLNHIYSTLLNTLGEPDVLGTPEPAWVVEALEALVPILQKSGKGFLPATKKSTPDQRHRPNINTLNKIKEKMRKSRSKWQKFAQVPHVIDGIVKPESEFQ